MYQEDFAEVSSTARRKISLLKNNPLGYFVASMLAGVYVGLAIMLIYSAGGMMTGLPYAKIVMGLSFGISLSLVVIAGAELFTGNNLVMTAGALKGTVTFGQTVRVWIVCYIGNWVGSVLLAVLFWGTGLASGPIGELIAHTSATKMAVPLAPLFLRAVLCNILVCLATWCSYRCKTESGKLIMIFWCLFAFITTGYEHSVANMSLLTVGMLAPGQAAVSMGGYFYNILVVTAGNMAGGILFTALPYFIISNKKES